jgi:hypothetical protein
VCELALHQQEEFPCFRLNGLLRDTPCRFLLDIGANTNFVSARFFKGLRVHVRQPQQEAVRTAGGTVPTLGRARLRVQLDSLIFWATFVVMEMQDDAVLGTPFWAAYGPLPDFENRTVLLTRVEGGLVLGESACVTTVDLPVSDKLPNPPSPHTQHNTLVVGCSVALPDNHPSGVVAGCFCCGLSDCFDLDSLCLQH